MTINSRQYDKKYFPLPLRLDFVNGVIWILLSDFEYHRKCGDIIKVPTGFRTDGASIPKVAWSWIGHPLGEYAPASVIHDFCCEHATWPRAKTDRIFLEAMRDCGVSYLKRQTMYIFVRLWYYWGNLQCLKKMILK